MAGNLSEKATRGYVTDYIGSPYLPIVPNIGDIAMMVGAPLLGYSIIRNASSGGSRIAQSLARIAHR
jgi:hypothetical protein